MSIQLHEFLIGGLTVNVFTSTIASVKPIVAFFLLHGRTGSAKDLESMARSMIETSQESQAAHDLVVITFDHRNHGTRLVEPRANNAWSRDETLNNDRHAIDMYSIQMGTAKDVSFLIDFLPSYLFPEDKRKIVDWGVAGISLGGHSAWIALAQEPRVTTGIPIIGCPDYITLISYRAEKSKRTVEPPDVPATLLALIQRSDPASMPYNVVGRTNPFFGKKVLVLSGEIDTLVPWSASQIFVEALEVGAKGVKKVVVHAGVGHECTDKMVREMAEFIRDEVLQ